MKILDQLNQLDRLDNLIRRKATGSPNQLAQRLNVSRRSVFNLIDLLKELGAEIEYCNHRQSYFYNNSVSFQFDIRAKSR